jgi:hypothetical protein
VQAPLPERAPSAWHEDTAGLVDLRGEFAGTVPILQVARSAAPGPPQGAAQGHGSPGQHVAK